MRRTIIFSLCYHLSRAKYIKAVNRNRLGIREISSEYRQSTLQYPGPYGVSPGYC